jgi:mannose/fructose/N-acetylgalactosamine-specific phosphotransferase system component IIC
METELENRKIEMDEDILKILNTSRKWTMFLAVTGYIFLGLFVVLGLLAGTFLTTFKSTETGMGIPESFTLIAIPVTAVILFFPGFFLIRYSKYMSHAAQHYDKVLLLRAFKNLKNYFAYIGILIIIFLAVYIIALVVAGSSVSLFNGPG